MMMLNKVNKHINKIANNLYVKFSKYINKYFENKCDKKIITRIIAKDIFYTFGFIFASLIFILFIILCNKEKDTVWISKVELNEFVNDDKYIEVSAKVSDQIIDLKLKYPKEKPNDEDIVDRLLKVINEDLLRGNNKSFNEITEKLNLITKNNYDAKITYESKNGYIDISNGNVIRPYENEKDYKDVLKVIIEYNDIKKIKEFYVTIKKTDYTANEETVNKVVEKIKDFDGTSNAFLDDGKLIDEIDNEKINWLITEKNTNKISYTYVVFILMIYLLLIYNEFSKVKKENNKKIISYEKEFATFIEDYYLLNNAGMNFSNSVIYINDRLEDGKKLKMYLNELSNEIKLGFNQYKVFEEFSVKTQSVKIIKFTRELIINLKRGNPNLDLFLKEKIKEFNGNKKDIYVKQAEENNIKALLPLMIILISTMLLVVYPAIVAMNF